MTTYAVPLLVDDSNYEEKQRLGSEAGERLRNPPPPPEPITDPVDPITEVRNEAGRMVAQMQQAIIRIAGDAMLWDPSLRAKLGATLSWHGTELQRLLDKLVATVAEREQPTEPAQAVQS